MIIYCLKTKGMMVTLFLFGLQMVTYGTNTNSAGVTHNQIPSNQRPNIIFILTDDQRWDALGYAGNKLVYTPEMDRLASAGVYFRKALVTTPICAASRASFLTGLHERTHGFNFQTGNIGQRYMQQAYPKVLKDAGYHTGFFGKFGVKYNGKDNLFNTYDDYDRNNSFADKRGYFYKTIGNDTVHLTRYTGHQALNFIDHAPAGKPFCLSLSFSAPHAHDGAPDQYFWQPETNHLLQNTTIPAADLNQDEYFNALPASVKNGFNRLRWTWRFDTPEKYQHSVKGYYRMIAGIDLEITAIRQKLQQKGLDKNTVIIVMGDNGYFLGERQLAGKWLMYDNSIRVPLIIYDPRNSTHRDVDAMALNIDIPATMLDLAGVQQPASWHGKSLVPVLTGTTNNLKADTVLIEHLWETKDIPPSEGVRTDRWKYFRYVNDRSIEELYNLDADPKEINNLARNRKFLPVLTSLRRKTAELINRYKDPFAGEPAALQVKFTPAGTSHPPHEKTISFNWVVPPQSGKPKGYQVLVASAITHLNNNVGDVWNSGHVPGYATTPVAYKGPVLQKGKTYYWKVRLWDEVNRTTMYSKPARFTP